MSRVYLAKSNLAEHSTLIQIRSELKKCFDEVIECEKNYSPTDLVKCDALVVLGHDFSHIQIDGNSRYTVGKGLFSTIQDWNRIKQNEKRNNVYFVVQYTASELHLRQIAAVKENGIGNWKMNYAWVFTMGDTFLPKYLLNKICGEQAKEPDKPVETTTRKRRLLG